jgi:WD40 repeat protein
LHTYEHGLPLDVDKYPTTFLVSGFVFCGATLDGTVTLWDVKQGDRLQSVRHHRDRVLLLLILSCTDSHLPQAGIIIHALAVRFVSPPGGLTHFLIGLPFL